MMIDLANLKGGQNTSRWAWRAGTVVLATITFMLAGCVSAPSGDRTNLCSVFREKGNWYDDAKGSFEKYGVPIHVQMAIVYQESRFEPHARPARKRFLGIPTFRPSSAYGFAQVKDETWDWYVDKSGNWGADRDDFGDITDFIGWYGKISYDRLKISKWDAHNQYLAYHEGHGGYAKNSHSQKAWLLRVARKVENNATRYAAQLNGCKKELESWWPF